jgi:DNA-binding CsgD family transcriptional regulator
MVAAWRDLSRRGALISAVVEDPLRTQGDEIVAAGMTYLVTEQFMDAVRQSQLPTLGHVLVRALKGNPHPALDHSGVREANSSAGLNLAFHALFRSGIEQDEQFGLILERLTRRFFEEKAGYKIKQAVTEAIGEQELRLHHAVGGHALEVQRVGYGDATDGGSEPCFRIWLHREAALRDPGSQFCRLFLYSAPRLYFNDKEQTLLQRAMDGMTDEELAANLSLSLSSVKKRWQSIYARVAEEAPDVLPGGSTASQSNGKRGVEKKQRLLEYVRAHPEELRPNVKPFQRG